MKMPLLPVLILLLLPPAIRGASFDWEAKPEGNHVMAFRLLVPDELTKARAVIVLVPGFNGDGRRMADDAAWQDLARRTQCALLACYMKGDQGGVYHEAEKWSGKVLLDALKKLAAESKHPELADAPIALWGHSAGGQFNFNFSCWKPERTVAFVANKGAYYGADIKPSVRKVPGLWFLGEKDSDLRVKNITARYEEGRKRGALWALVPEPNLGHGVGRSRELGMVFIEEVLAMRLDSFGKLQPANPGAGWLGDLGSKEIEKNTASDGGPKTKGWMPGEKTAALWKDVVSGVPSQSPEAPAAEEETPSNGGA